MFAVLKREYLQAVRKKMFVIMTFLMPVLMLALFFLPALMMERGMGTKKIAVLDASGALRDAFDPKSEEGDLPADPDVTGRMEIDYVAVSGEDLENAAAPYLERMQSDNEDRLDGVFLIPSGALASNEENLKYYSRSATDFITQERLARRTNRLIQERRLVAEGIDAAKLEQLMADLDVDAVQLSRSGEEKKGGVANFFAGFVLAALLIVPSFVYGLEIMRGIIQEKTDRVVEVLVSSMTPSQLLIGKIMGVALVGLTQISVWLLMAGGAAAIGTATAALAGENVMQLLRVSTFVYFVIFFILAYLTYVCVYAIGGAVCNSEKEAQQLIAPITMIMMLPWFLMAAIITNPESGMSVGFSLAPVFGPMTMYVRTLVSEPPMWHVLLSIVVSIATIAAFFWVTAKIFRIGILSYGKRPTLPELWRWLKVA
jgi:ABC-2 type transport system permease protein